MTDKEALCTIFIGGNHLASALIGFYGPDLPEYQTPPEEARQYFSDTNLYDCWVCWRTIMLVRDEVAEP